MWRSPGRRCPGLGRAPRGGSRTGTVAGRGTTTPTDGSVARAEHARRGGRRFMRVALAHRRCAHRSAVQALGDEPLRRRSRVVLATPGPIVTACLTVLMAPDRATFGKRTCDGHRRELMPMRPSLRLAKLRCPATEATLDVSAAAIAPVPELPSAPRIHPELPRARPAARSARLRWPLPAGQATIVPCPSPHDRHPRYRRACR